jgi:putative membrane-bound dehydrogenase-like protein
MKYLSTILLAAFCCAPFLSCDRPGKNKLSSGPRRIEILFLGHASEHHHSAGYLPMLAAALAREGINFTYTESPNDLNPETLAYYDGLMIYANHEQMSASQEKALLDFVESGKGFIPIHSASFCFQNSPEYIQLVGGQFQKHDTGTFVADIVKKDHPIMQSVDTFSTWDETYVHHKLTDDLTVLMERVEGDHREPWTWVKEHGKGRVFYTAYGHDERSWSHPQFHELVKEGILWAVGDGVRSQWEKFASDIPTLTYRDAPHIPNYEKRNPPPKYQEPLSPSESAKLIQVPSGFELELFASEPDIINPVAMDWDERGRLWVIETVDYPNTVRDDKTSGDDRIKICEDTDGDGKADKFTVFAEGLNIPTSLVFSDGGVIVAQAPYFLFLKDNDGDDRADVREIIMEGWGTYDTHAGPSNLKYGYDNNIWGVVGYSGFKGTIAGEPRQFRQGIYRFSRDVSRFEFLTGTSNNTWGLGLTENNDVFASTANNTHSVYMGIPNQVSEGVEGIPLGSPKIDGHYAMHPVTDKVRQVDVFGGFTAASGHNFYSARSFPQKYWGRAALVTEPTGHLVHIAWIEKDGAGFVEKDGWNLFAGADEWVAPVEARPGPDGAVWVLDWYNFIVQHNPTPTPDRGGYSAVNGAGNAYENALRDKSHGRIWRVVYREAEPYKPMTLRRDKPEDLVDALSSDNHFWRMTAQRLLVETKNVDVLPDLYDLIENHGTDEQGEHYAAIHALWTLDGMGAIQSGNEAFHVATEALKHPAPGVRKAAIEILSGIQWTEGEIIKSGVLDDADTNTRLSALLSLTRVAPSTELGKKLFEVSNEEAVKADNWLAKAVYIAATRHRKGFTEAFRGANPDFNTVIKETKRQAPGFDDSKLEEMNLPQAIEDAGLDMDGIVWFRKVVDIPATMTGKKGLISLGPIDDSDETWINGVKVGGLENQYARPRSYDIAPTLLKAGKNIVAIRMVDTGSRGGVYGKPEEMFIRIGGNKISLAGSWKYDIERNFTGGDEPLFGNISIAEMFMTRYGDKPLKESPETENNSEAEGKIVIRIKARQNEMKYDLKTFTVEAGKPVEIIFENPDFMQHNLVITKPGAMEVVGRAADKLATDAKGASMHYVPDIPEVLYHTPLVNPEETFKLEFIAPSSAGDYPYVCTFPGHWSLMNGVMKVTKTKSAL